MVDKENPEYQGEFNEISCVARLFTPDDKAIVSPSDTPYCMQWMDLRTEPMVPRLYGSESTVFKGKLTPPVLKKVTVVAQDSVTTQKSVSFEHQVTEYTQKFPYQDTFDYAMLFTGGDPAKLNIWVMVSEAGTGQCG